VKEKIAAEEGISVAEQQLIYCGKRLYNNDTIALYNVHHESTLHLVLRLQTGPAPLSGATVSVPTEQVFPNDEEAWQAVEEWRLLGEKGGFDADTHIVAPQAHETALQSLEHTVVTSSELYRQSGTYDFGAKPNMEAMLFGLLDTRIPSNAPAWIYDFMLNLQNEDVSAANRQSAMTLCQTFAVIQSVIDRFDLLVSKKFSTTFFSILLLRDENVAEIVKIPRDMLAQMAETLLIALRPNRSPLN
jgi:hypothetical protein